MYVHTNDWIIQSILSTMDSHEAEMTKRTAICACQNRAIKLVRHFWHLIRFFIFG